MPRILVGGPSTPFSTEAVPEWSLAEVVAALQAVRGIDLIATVGVLAEIGDLSRLLLTTIGTRPSLRQLLEID